MSGSDSLHILLIEDNPDDALLFDHILKESFNNRYHLSTAYDLGNGKEILRKETFDIVILDLSLPDSFGLQSFKQVQDECQHMPIIVLTGMEDEATGINAVKLGAQDFLIKGKIKSKTLRRSINYSIERYKLLKELSENSRKLEERTRDLLLEKQKLSEAQKLAHIGSWEWDISSNSFTASEELNSIYGLPPDALMTSFEEFAAFIHAGERQNFRDLIQSSCTSLQSFDFHYRILRKDGLSRTLHARGEILADKEGKAYKVLGTGQDVTERFHEQELEKLVMAATKSFNSVMIRDRDGRIEWVNEGFTKLCGYTLEDVKGTFGEILQNDNKEYIALQKMYYSRVIKEKIPVSFENVNYTKDGKGFWTITTLTPVLGNDKNVARVIAIDSDITLRKQMEEELLQANKIAEHSLMKGNKALTELMVAKKQLEESMKVKEQFLANMSHEIRTPMNAIIGFTNLLLKTPLNPDQGQYIDAIRTSGENLLVIINDILDFSKIQSGKINFEQIDLRLSIAMAAVTEMMLHKSVEKGIKLSNKIDKRIHDHLIGDPTRLSQILLNLVGNAIKFTEKGEVKIIADLVTETADEVYLKFSVVDTGIGIPEEKLDTIFEGFTQATNDTTRKYGGTGLGLSIVKQLVELQGGTIDVKSKLHEGSSFSFTLKFKKNNRPDEDGIKKKDGSYQTGQWNGLRVLLVEDNLLNQILAKKVLTDWDWKPEVAENGAIAVQKLEKSEFDLVLMDIQLPEMDGYEATRYIRKQMAPPKAYIPIIAMTAHAISGEAEKCISAGMDGYISKPFDPKDLYTKVSQVMSSKRLNGTPSEEINTINKTPQKMEKKTDLTYLRQLSNGSNEFVLQMITIFLDQTPKAIETMEESLAKKDYPAIRAAAHKMKPSFSFMGMANLKDIIVALEEEAEKGQNPQLMAEKIAAIKNECATALEELKIDLKSLA